MTTLHPHEAAAMTARGRVLLVRPVEPQPKWEQRTKRHVVIPGWDWGAKIFGFPNIEEFRAALVYHCPLGGPGDTLTTDAGPVTVERVRVQRLQELTIREVLGWAEPPPFRDLEQVQKLWQETYPAYPWGRAWVWAVEITNGD